MIKRPDTEAQRKRRHRRVRGKISGTADCPRLNVYRSSKNIYAQLVDDIAGVTLCSASTIEDSFKGKSGGNKEAAGLVGKLIAEKAKSKKIEQAVFDRGGYLYHGRVQALAESARENGLKF